MWHGCKGLLQRLRWTGCVVLMVAACAGNDEGLKEAALPVCGDAPRELAACGVCTTLGFVEGFAQGQGCEYLGIPYAQPPVDDLRFAAPVPATGWDDIRSVDTYSAACPQGQPLLTGGATTSEDCLYLNVHAPAEATETRLPVMVFVHGGGNTGGTASTYNGRALSEAGPVVVITMNYRLGALGFFSHPVLEDERGPSPSGNDGILDQQLAMRWVQDNVAAFGGDPNNVTVFGESAGSTNSGVHLVSPRSAGLAHRFMMQSGVPLDRAGSGDRFSRERRHAATTALADDLCAGEADVLSCLRALPAATLMNWSSSAVEVDWGPMVDGEGGVLPREAASIIEDGDANPGQVVLGTNMNEQGLFQLLGGAVSTMDALRALLDTSFPGETDAILALYADAGSSPSALQIQIMTDVRFRCPTRRMARLLSDAGRDTYLYSFNEGQAWHADELGYVFGGSAFYTLALGTPNPSLVQAIQGYWVDFAASGDPNGGDRPAWPTYDAQSDRHMELVQPPTAAAGLTSARCDFWDAYVQAQ